MFAHSLRLAALPLALAFASLTAHADTFDWSLTSPATPTNGGFADTGFGTLTATEIAGVWTIDSISGSFGGDTIKNLLPVGSFESNNNLLFPTGTTSLSTSGVSFVTDLGTEANIFSFFGQGSAASGNAYGEIVTNGAFGVGLFNLTAVAATPEPSSLALLGTGLIGAFQVARRRFVR